jgi:hypothetical protein
MYRPLLIRKKIPSACTPGSPRNSFAVDCSSQSPMAPVINLAHPASSPTRKVHRIHRGPAYLAGLAETSVASSVGSRLSPWVPNPQACQTRQASRHANQLQTAAPLEDRLCLQRLRHPICSFRGTQMVSSSNQNSVSLRNCPKSPRPKTAKHQPQLGSHGNPEPGVNYPNQLVSPRRVRRCSAGNRQARR